tara:strand:- start:784 stop:1074 length:291 start_codon:yes stop_codon:yes gene_type:complete
MAIYKNISSVTTETLIAKNSSVSGNISKINIANHDNSDLVIVKLYLYDGTNTYTITENTIPPLVTLVLDDNLSFDKSIFDLKIDTSTTAEITVIIT